MAPLKGPMQIIALNRLMNLGRRQRASATEDGPPKLKPGLARTRADCPRTPSTYDRRRCRHRDWSDLHSDGLREKCTVFIRPICSTVARAWPLAQQYHQLKTIRFSSIC